MASKTISQLTAATTPLAGTEELPIVQGGVTKKTTAQDIADLGGGGATYTKYVATLNVIEDNQDNDIVFENTTGLTFTWTANDVFVTTTLPNTNKNKLFILVATTNNYIDTPTGGEIHFSTYETYQSGSSTVINLPNPYQPSMGDPYALMVEIRIYP